METKDKTTKKIASIGERIKTLRKQKEMTQNELAKKLGIEQARMSRIESDYSNLTSDLIVKLSSIFCVSCDYILTGKEYSNPGVYLNRDDMQVFLRIANRIHDYMFNK